MIETLYEGFLVGALCLLALMAFAYLLRTVIGPTFFDRILGVNNISTLVIIMISIIAYLQEESYIVDVAMIYSMLGFVTVVIVCKAYLRSHDKDPRTDFQQLNVTEEEEKDA